MSSLDWIRSQNEGQFFERKSCYDRSGSRVKRRDVRLVAKDVAETLAAMANADGGTLVLGIEDDGTPTGMDYPEDRMEVLRAAPVERVRPPLRVRLTDGMLDETRILLYEVDWSAEAHQLTDGRYLLRVDDRNMPFPASDIEALKEGKRRRVTEARFVAEASLTDLDETLIRRLAAPGETVEQVLLRYRLAEARGRGLMLTLASLLLFGRDPGRWHPRCGVDFVRYEGAQRRVGADLNIIKRQRLDAPLVMLIEQAYQAVQSQVRERHELVDLFFTEHFEYPAFAWQEAIVNAVAHRDYRYEGLGIEIWMFDDRLEVRSPGELVEPVTLERLRRRERIHATRNPRIARVLTDVGFMREQGEGIPRMFETMEHEGLYPPELQIEAGVLFVVTLRNEPIYSRETMRWLAQFEGIGLNQNQLRVLAFAREHGNAFTSRTYQERTQVDLYTASREIKDLIRRGIVRLRQKGGRIYQVLEGEAHSVKAIPEELKKLEPILRAKGFVKNEDIRDALGLSRRQALRVVGELVDSGWLIAEGERRGRRYVPGPRASS